jgi:hypothetical protein
LRPLFGRIAASGDIFDVRLASMLIESSFVSCFCFIAVKAPAMKQKHEMEIR